MKTYLFVRLSDLFSTWLAMSKYGSWEKIEGAPISEALIKSLGYTRFMILNLLISLVLYWGMKRFLPPKVFKYSLKGFLYLNSLVVLVNLYTVTI